MNTGGGGEVMRTGIAGIAKVCKEAYPDRTSFLPPN